MTISVRTGSMVKENIGKAMRLLPARRKYLDKHRLGSRNPSIQALLIFSSGMVYQECLVQKLTVEIVILSSFSTLDFSSFGA